MLTKKIVKKKIKVHSKTKALKLEIAENNKALADIKRKIEMINKEIMNSTGEKQEKLHNEIAEIKLTIARLTAKLEIREQEEQSLYEAFQKLFMRRNDLQDEQMSCEKKTVLLNKKLKS